ncbi:DUF4892 domain-containing protein [Cellvibrio sp. PSBB023]|uniref:DUF4892 domain-containing protein n=1 Tax=Cellvibrio sp. PSBB023 TaxID=1945512 RepID=UPI00099032C7|nr:DUF4892 domain-containing protein [Cellvibrio sp. PSBB023]AQT59468.1 DUF4892 domain-containing protein [Cellvibrio sp. PSBB023]
MKVFVVFFVLAFSHIALAADLSIQPYHNARIMFQSTGATDDYVFALGSYKKIAGSWRLDRQQRLSGNLTRYTVELPEGHSANNGFDFYLDQLQNFNLRELFHCTGRDCGTSNSWANNHFKILQLYGLDQFQQYGAYEVTNADARPFYVALYAVQRGNKRVYMQLDVLHVDSVNELGVAANPESIIRALESSGYYVFPDLLVSDAQGSVSIKIKPAHLQVLVDVLNAKPNWTLAVVGHDYAPVALAVQQKNSLAYAEQLKAALQEAGVKANRLVPYGLGGLAPAGRGDRAGRVELVKIDP